ncbi:protein CBFA2T2 isoform X2 [Hermetia illucens]|uniref:protein CBFA2T2 isoform X2 n=1 Tax=Hermetia illucens TaxID=343691 RepID=UPI0018CC03C8|nr:protein CBFA2T2 isoform X2 [Hermetia illucens]
MMALDGKTIIKEEIPDKEVYESTANNRRTKGNGKDNCRTPDSPESARAVAPRSPMSPQIHHSSLAPPRPNRNASSSPVVNGATTTPPPPPVAAAITPHLEQSRALAKVRKFLGSLVQITQDSHPEISDRTRALVLSLASGGISIDEFRTALQDITSYPLRPNIIPFMKTHIPLLQREIASLARATNQTPLQYVTSNESSAIEFSHGSSDHAEIFLPVEGATVNSSVNGNGLVFKRRPSDTLGDQHNVVTDWNDYIYPPAKRLHSHTALMNSSHLFSSQPSLFEYQGSAGNQSEAGFGVLLDKSNHRDDRDPGSRCSDSQRSNRMSGEEEWKNIHTMLNCISAMVDKTKRAITILQQRGVDPQPNYSDTAVIEIRRQTEEKVAELKRNAEDAVNQVKRQAVIEIQRAVAAAENRAAEVMAQERLKMEKFFADMSKHATETDVESKSPSLSAGQNACWNCGRKANETCSGCNLARYCGAFCQHKDWEHHHQICGNVRPEVTAKHPAQTVRAQITRSPPSQPQPQVSATTQPPSVVTNGVNSGGGTK